MHVSLFNKGRRTSVDKHSSDNGAHGVSLEDQVHAFLLKNNKQYSTSIALRIYTTTTIKPANKTILRDEVVDLKMPLHDHTSDKTEDRKKVLVLLTFT